jgi:hypothetical protein
VKYIGTVTGGTVVTINSKTEKDVSILLLDKESISSMRNTSSGFALTSFRLTEDGYIDQELYGINSPIAFQLWYPGSVDCGY